MARMQCSCGALLSNGQAPNDIELVVYTDREWEAMFECEQIEPWKIPPPKYDVWRCPECKSIYVYEKGSDRPVMVYRLEKN